MGKKLRDKLSQPRQSEQDIRQQLEKELHDLLQQRPIDDWMNPLLGLAGKLVIPVRVVNIITESCEPCRR